MLFVDVDGLKAVNDRYGHKAGDQVLADLGQLMHTTFRTSDVVGRLGGDEFCALLTTDGAELSLPVARLNQAIEDHNASAARAVALSCSIGAVTHQPHKDSLVADLLSRADQAMYEARQARRRPLILIIENDPGTRLVYETYLSQNFDVVSAETGRAAMELAVQEHPSVVLVDLGLPDMDGQQIVAELRNRSETMSVPVIVATSSRDESAELASFRAGVAGFLVKPVDLDALGRSVEQALERTPWRGRDPQDKRMTERQRQ